MMSVYSPKRVRSLKLAATFIRVLAALLALWPFLLLAAAVLSPVTPHLRWEYSYREFGKQRHYTSCAYLGARGFVPYRRGSDCPLVVLIDLREMGRW
ncbi:MAG: hypothetical protein KME41_08375 [Candidatus Thiodiazotropha sp. (ex Lucina pensylvanica)]|nr:hypothetical protein [Candidatus Thiodiazotropha sp. (ex Lucina pensylvanica)]